MAHEKASYEPVLLHGGVNCIFTDQVLVRLYEVLKPSYKAELLRNRYFLKVVTITVIRHDKARLGRELLPNLSTKSSQ